MATSVPTSSTATFTTTEPFPPLDITPRTPTTASVPTSLPTITEVAETTADQLQAQQQSLQLPSFHSVDFSPKSDRFRASPVPSPFTFTGAIAVADAKRQRQQQQDARSRQTTPNPSLEAMHSLMGIAGISKPSDAPPTSSSTLSEPMRKVAEKIVIPDTTHHNNNNITNESLQTSPVSVSSFGTNNHEAAMTATTGSVTSDAPHFVAEPADMLAATATPRPQPSEPEQGNKAFSYPGGGPVQQQQKQHQQHQQSQNQQQPAADEPHRGMSLPGLSYVDSAQSSPAGGTKRHKCPYCETDFTRHHNLKSHLLTHSQEKPYVCHTCQARFRRLHDLKRHARLHTGERPHTCDKCGRSFARGDALARHNKGPGGCAGRRSSFGGEDGDDGDGMDGIEYGVEDGDDSMLDTNGRRVSEPSRKRVHIEAPNDPSRTIYRQHSSTYPPVNRLGDMGPPAVVNNNVSQATSPRDTSHAGPPTYYPGFAQHTGVMTESPKPLSPGQPAESNRLSIDAGTSMGRNRSPSLTTQFQQTHFGRGSGGRTPPQPGQFQTSQQLPPLSLSTNAARPALHSNLSGPGPSMLHHQQVPSRSGSGSNPASASSHGQSSGSSMRDILAGGGPGSGGGDADLWTHLRNLEGRFSRMQDEYELRISRLQEEVISLRGQLHSVANGGAAHGTYPGEPRY